MAESHGRRKLGDCVHLVDPQEWAKGSQLEVYGVPVTPVNSDLMAGWGGILLIPRAVLVTL